MHEEAVPAPTALAQREVEFALLKRISLPIWIFDVDHSRVYWANDAAIAMWRATDLRELCARDMGQDMSTSVARRLQQYRIDFVRHDSVFSEQWTIYPGGVPCSMQMQLRGVRLGDGRMAMLCESRYIEPDQPESVRSVEALLHTPVMISLYDEAGAVLYRNPAARESVPDLTLRLGQRLVDADALDRLQHSVRATGEAKQTLAVHTSAGQRWHDVSVRQCKDALTGRDALLVSEVDVSDIKRAQAQSQYLARHDTLTGLPNRAQIMQWFQSAIVEMEGTDTEAALIYIDLDHFKDINDTLGHAAGDALLVQISERLRGMVRGGDVVARLGGDEFLILMVAPNVRDEVSKIGHRLRATVALPVQISGTEVTVTPSVGVSIYPADGHDMDSLLRNADLAMYAAKDGGRNNLTFFQAPMADKLHRRLEMESDLRHALEQGEFEVYYQPRVQAATGALVGAEALVRWKHPVRGMVNPTEFIPVCESTGMIAELGDFVFRQAALQQSQWAQAGFDLLVSVNLSPRQFRDPELLGRMAAVMSITGCQPGRIELELTESMLLGHDKSTIEFLGRLRSMGFSISVDDFGTGYSNLAYLNQFPIRSLKIDKTFVQDIETRRSVAELIVSMCRLMHLHIVAEGVETAAQLAWVQSQGIEEYQGYYYARPLPAAEFSALLRSNATLCQGAAVL